MISGKSDVASRLRDWREKYVRASLEEFAKEVNLHLPEEHRRGPSTVNEWEIPGSTAIRAEWIAGLKKAYQDLNLDWLLFGGKSNPPRLTEKAAQERAESARVGRLLAPWDAQLHHRDRQDLPPEAKVYLLAFLHSVRQGALESFKRDVEKGRKKGRKVAETPALVKDLMSGGLAFDRFAGALHSILRAPFQDGDYFVPLEQLSEGERTTYVMSILAALRPLVRVLRNA